MSDSNEQYEDYHDERAPQYTKILDLTNGEGGERRPSANRISTLPQRRPSKPDHHYFPPNPAEDAGDVDDYEDDEDDEEEEDEVLDMANGASDQPRGSSSRNSAVPSVSKRTGGGKIAVNPNTPGKVVESGQEQTGRWTKQEHEAFLEALQMFGKEWKKVAAKVKTRTVVQTRTHAQKYFQKLQKIQESSGGSATDVDFVDMGIAPDSSSKPSRSTNASGTQSSGTKSKKQKAAQQQTQNKSQQLATATNAGILSSMKGNRRGSSATLSAAQVISGLSGASVSGSSLLQPPSMPFVSGSSSSTGEDRQPLRAQHAFSTVHAASGEDSTMAAPSFTTSSLATTGWPTVTSSVATASSSSMKIVAPDPLSAFKKGKFPEPSPAATGKRKLAEIAAARMLAGVAGGVVPSKDSSAPAQVTTSFHPSDTTIMSSSPLDDREGADTPPPEPEYATKGLNEVPVPPLFVSDPVSASGKPGLSLQILNPDALGVTPEKKRKIGDGDSSPVTPWDGELEALVNEKAKSDQGQEKDDSEQDEPGTRAEESGEAKEPKLHVVCGPSSSFGRSKLHRAVCELDIESIQFELGEVANRNVGALSRLDSAGFAPLHTAASLCMVKDSFAAVSLEMVRLLLSAGADPNIRDNNGNTPVHWASRAGNADIVSYLLLRNSQIDAKNKQGETPLHWAMRAGRVGAKVMGLLVESGSRVSATDGKFRRPIDVAGEGYYDSAYSIASLKARDLRETSAGVKMSRELKRALREKTVEIGSTRNGLFERSSASRTLVLHHPECLEHVAKSQADWEAPDRVVAVMTRVSQPNLLSGEEEIRDHEITLSSEFERANLDLLSRVHSTEYLHFLHNLSKDLEKQLKTSGGEFGEDDGKGTHVVPFTPMVQRSMIKVSESAVKSVSNSDTAFSAGSLRAARRAAGAVQHAVDCVLVGRNRNSFCVVRPPGHHAGVNGLLDGGESCGFCLFNNVAAGALYAISHERLFCERCAIVDIDVHHGNGTEEIVRKCHDPSKLFFFSIHLYDNDKRKRGSGQFQYKFYPGTGSDDDLALNIINVPLVPLWKDNTSPAPPVTRTHNTRQKTRTSDPEEESPVGTPRKSGQNSDAGSESGSVNNISSPRPPNPKYQPLASGRLAYRDAIQNRLLPALRAFNPDLILISSGFDACKGDVGNARHERGGRERVGLDLDPEDYAWTTRKILEIADICCSGKVVSVLEGGYGMSNPSNSDSEDISPGLDRSLFSECAIRHLHALIDPYDLERRFSSTH